MRRGSGVAILDREIEWASTAFLEGRLAEKATFDWAAGLSSDKVAERNAIRTLLNYRDPKPEEPYRTAWFWVCEAWDEPTWPDEARLEMIEALQRGVAPLTFVRHVVELVRPRLTVEPASAPRRKGRITDFTRLISLNLGAEDLVSLEDLSLDAVQDLAFFNLLASQLEGELRYGLARAARIGGSAVYLANWIERVYPAQLADPNGGFSDPDEYRRGFGPLVKLLHQVVEKLHALEPKAARDHVQGWRRHPDALFQRLWAAAARNPGLATPADVGAFLRTVEADRFWSIGHFPEITELRGRRFAELNADDRVAIERRLLQTPPAALFLRRLSKSERDSARRSWTRRELRRLEVGGGVPTEAVEAWTTEFAANGETYTNLTSVTSDLDNAYNFPWRAEMGEYDGDDIKDVLPVLERDLADTDYGGKAEGAASYSHAHADDVLNALEASEPGLYPRVLASLAESEASRGRGAEAAAGLDLRAQKVLDALVRLSDSDLEASASAFSGWLNVWAKHLAADRRIWAIWIRLWPTAVALSNKAPVIVSSSASGSRDDRNDRLAMEALNSPAGHLISALFSVLPNLTVVPHPFANEDLRRVRDTAFTATGDARLQVLHRFLSALEYMRVADPEWTEHNLLRPLAQAEHQDLEIWDAIARRGVSPESLKTIGPRLVMVARGGSLPAKTRAGLARTATYAVLRNLKDGDDPIIPLADLQQMLRLGGDEVRIAAARTLKDFLQAKAADPVTQFTPAVETFLRQVWPADQTLRTGSLSDALAELPAAAGTAFPAAEAAIADFIVPFDAWTLHAFGFYAKVEGSEVPRRKTTPSMNRDEAASWLDLLDRSIGRSEGAVYPRDLALALDAISSGDRALMSDPRFQRLVALVRK